MPSKQRKDRLVYIIQVFLAKNLVSEYGGILAKKNAVESKL